MAFPYAYTPSIWPILTSAAFLAALGIYALRHRTVPGAVPFTIFGTVRSKVIGGRVEEFLHAYPNLAALVYSQCFSFTMSGGIEKSLVREAAVAAGES